MASIHDLNQPPHPLWDFVSSLEEHPFFAAHFRGPPPPHPGFPHHHPHHHGHPFGPGPHHAWFQERSGNENTNENTNENAPPRETAANANNEAGQENVPPADNATPPTRGLGDNAGDSSRERHGRGGRGGWHGHPRGHSHGSEHGFRGHHGGFGPGARGCRGRGGPHGRGRGWGHHARGRFGVPPFAGGGQFDLPGFLERLGSRLGIDLDQTWREFSQGYSGQQQQQVDFVPRADIFDTPSEYVIHVSLPGAQKPDLSVNYDVDDSILHLAGVVYRPGITEALNDALVVDGRSREVGVFEREIKLGTPTEPAHVDADQISAKLANGILVVRVPKVVPVETERLKKKISVEAVDDEKSGSKQASVEEDSVEDESDAMHVDSETEKGENYEPEIGEDTTLAPDEDYDEGKEYVKVDVE